jgi:hypothetical protein
MKQTSTLSYFPMLIARWVLMIFLPGSFPVHTVATEPILIVRGSSGWSQKLILN